MISHKTNGTDLKSNIISVVMGAVNLIHFSMVGNDCKLSSSSMFTMNVITYFFLNRFIFYRNACDTD